MVNATALSSMIAAGILGSSGTFSVVDTNGFCVDLANSNSVDFNPIIVFPCHLGDEGANQEWVFTLVAAPNTFSISNAFATASDLAFPTTEATSIFQGAVARVDSGITWLVESDSTFGPSVFNSRCKLSAVVAMQPRPSRMVNSTSLSSIIAAGILGSSGIFSIKDTNGLCIDLAGGQPFDFDPIILFSCHLDNSPANQEWTFTLVSLPNIFSITSVGRPNSFMAFPTTQASSTFQGLVGRLNSSITWRLVADSTFGSTSYNLIETVDGLGGALTSFNSSPLTVQTFNGGGDATQAFTIAARSVLNCQGRREKAAILSHRCRAIEMADGFDVPFPWSYPAPASQLFVTFSSKLALQSQLNMVNATALSSMIAAGILGSSSTFSITDSNGLCIDLAGGNPFDFEPIILFTCHLDNEPLNQEWIFTLVSSPNVFSISNALQTASVMAFPTTETGSTFQGLVARLDSSITWTLEPDSTFGPSAFNSWTDNELTAFSIQVDTVDAATFFSTSTNRLSDPAVSVSAVILTNERQPQGPLTKVDRLFFRYMKDAETGEESLVDDFAAFVLGMFGYDEPDRVIHRHKELSFIMCGTQVDAKPDLCVMSDSEYLLLVQEGKRGTNRVDPEPQLIVEAIAAFYQNNLRRKTAGLPQVNAQTIPGITMVGVAPIFYRIPVTMELVKCVQAGGHPPQPTVVQRFIPPVPYQATYPEEGLVPLANRDVVMKCFETFKALVVSLFSFLRTPSDFSSRCKFSMEAAMLLKLSPLLPSTRCSPEVQQILDSYDLLVSEELVLMILKHNLERKFPFSWFKVSCVNCRLDVLL
ncbi:hypothetical protein CVT26_006416 [Gymnopilus dilepis]|uniref:Ricin B lectin domain-containing protein n=1 Tax=Gymnopilus dilepis TaxID=231916 RepID=A0A409Y1Y7_9AGAR|nr:hypothetical protein CVT26_006416 [Gymnopilus dilepis]